MGNEDVKKYYDENTHRFLKYSQAGKHQNIHQPLWETKNVLEAINYSNQLVLDEVLKLNFDGDVSIGDFGCGVGSTLIYIGNRIKRPINLYGISISQEQIKMAERRKKNNLTNKLAVCGFVEADFLNIPAEISDLDLVFSIEAFVHSSDPAAYFKSVNNHLKLGGKLILIDDFLIDKEFEQETKAGREIKRFEKGWKLGSLRPLHVIEQMALEHGFVCEENANLTDLLKIDTWRDKCIRLGIKWSKPFGKSTYFDSLEGGDARQIALKNGWVQYRMFILKKEKEL